MTNIIWNLIGRKEYNIDRIILSASILYSLNKQKTKNNIFEVEKINSY